jgi:hypothetical protein
MSRSLLVRTTLLATLATLAVLPARAVAAPPAIDHFSDTGKLQDVDLCGITVDVAFRVTSTTMFFFDKDGMSSGSSRPGPRKRRSRPRTESL